MNSRILVIDGSSHELVPFHFHTPSEHRVGERTYPGELHLVHLNEHDHFTVIAVLTKSGAHNPDVDAIWETFPNVENTGPIMFDASVLLPDNQTAYVYDGSLTTPPCSENVRWLVMKGPVQFSGAQIEQLTAVHASANIHNNRPRPAAQRAQYSDSSPHITDLFSERILLDRRGDIPLRSTSMSSLSCNSRRNRCHD